jgi:hypothetical protein
LTIRSSFRNLFKYAAPAFYFLYKFAAVLEGEIDMVEDNEILVPVGVEDIVTGMRAAFQWKKVLWMTVGVFISLIFYGFFAWLGSKGADSKMATSFIFIANAFAGLVAIILMTVFGTGIARWIILDTSDGEEPTTVKDIIEFIKSRLAAIILCPIFIYGIAAIFVIILLMLTFMGSIKFVGPLLFGVGYLVYFLISLAVIALLLSLFWVPLIIAIDELKSPSAVLEKLFNVWRRRIPIILTIQAITWIISGIVYSVIMVITVAAMSNTFILGKELMGKNFRLLVKAVPNFFAGILTNTSGLPIKFFYQLTHVTKGSGVTKFSALCLGVNMVLILSVAMAIPLVFMFSCGALAYWTVTQDPEDALEEKQI